MFDQEAHHRDVLHLCLEHEPHPPSGTNRRQPRGQEVDIAGVIDRDDRTAPGRNLSQTSISDLGPREEDRRVRRDFKESVNRFHLAFFLCPILLGLLFRLARGALRLALGSILSIPAGGLGQRRRGATQPVRYPILPGRMRAVVVLHLQ